MEHHYIILDSNNQYIWESQESENQIDSLETGIDIIFSDYLKFNYKSISIPDFLFYSDYLIDSKKYCHSLKLLSWNKKQNTYNKLLSSSKNDFLKKQNSFIENKKEKLNQHINQEYYLLFDFSKEMIKDINHDNEIQKLYRIANKKNNLSKTAKLVIKLINNHPVNEKELVLKYGGIETLVNSIGQVITKIKQNNFQEEKI